jgi:ribosomal protein S6--L-glutamate ligase
MLLNQVLEAFNGLQARALVQEYIAEAKGIDIRALIVDGQVVGAMKRIGKPWRISLEFTPRRELLNITE